MKKIALFLHTCHRLSLDVVLAVIASVWAVGKLQKAPSLTNSLLLGGVVWLIYSADHILDSRQKGSRHSLHKTYRQRLLWAMTIVFLGCFIMLFFIDISLIINNIWILFCVVLYLFWVQKSSAKSKWLLFKEPVVTVLFTAGVWGAGLSETSTWQIWFLKICYGLLVFQNLLICAWFEQKTTPGITNIVTILRTGLPDKLFAITIILLLLLVLGLLFFGSPSIYQIRFALTEILMGVAFCGIAWQEKLFAKKERFRWATDAVFWVMMGWLA